MNRPPTSPPKFEYLALRREFSLQHCRVATSTSACRGGGPVPLPAGRAVGPTSRLLPRTSTAERRPTRQMTSAARLTCATSVFSTQVVIVDTLPCAGRRRVPPLARRQRPFHPFLAEGRQRFPSLRSFYVHLSSCCCLDPNART